MRALLLGAGGMLGHDLAATAPKDVDLVRLTHQDLDITDTPSLSKTVADLQPDMILNTAAYTAVDRAEADPENAFRVNSEAVAQIGRLAAQHNAYVVHFSTDYVFDGTTTSPYTESAKPNPINVYGASKLAGEEAMRRLAPGGLIVRTQWLFGIHGRSFPRTMLERASNAIRTRVVTDQIGRPTYTCDLAEVTWSLVGQRASGLVHVANGETASWYEFAAEVFAYEDRAYLLEPCRTIDYPTPARRPSYTVLDTTLCERTLNRTMRPWREGLNDFLHTSTRPDKTKKAPSSSEMTKHPKTEGPR